jgi:hypothetical protein
MMNENELKQVWRKAGEEMSSQVYSSATLEQFMNSRSTSIGAKVKRLLQIDIFIKSALLVSLLVNVYLYFDTFTILSVCLAAILLLAGVTCFEFKTMERFNQVTDPSKSAKDNLTSMLTFLQSRFETSTLAIALTHLFGFTSGLLIYFYLVYGRVRPLDAMDYFVFGTFYLIGILFGIAATKGQVKYHIKHLKACLSDLNENVLAVVSSHIEDQRKQDHMIKLLLMLLVVFGFVVLIAVLKQTAG